MLKRTFDIVFSIFGIIVLSPLLLFIYLCLKTTGSAFYRGERVGKDGKIFKIWKFRTMVENAEKIGGPSTAGDDPRLTDIGKWLKKRKLDELPQLFNILAGQMSFTGRRPEVQEYVDLIPEPQKTKILRTKPGITSWASIWDFREEEVLRGKPDPEKYYLENIFPMKIKLDVLYAEKGNFWVDIKIILETIWRILH